MAKKKCKDHPIATPLHDRVILEVLDVDDVSVGGIILPDTAKDKSTRGKVLAVGPGKTYPRKDGGFEIATMSVAVGDIVVFGAYSGIDLKINGQKLRVLSEGEVLAVMP